MKMYVWATGKIEIGKSTPDGAIEVAAAPKKNLEDCLVYAVLGYDNSGHFVTGICEENTQTENFEALKKYKQIVQRKIDGLHPFTGKPLGERNAA